MVLSSRQEARGLQIARKSGVQTYVIPRTDALTTRVMNNEIHEKLKKHSVELVLLLGFLSFFEPRGYKNCVLNIHPSLLPDFGGRGMYGRHVHEAVLASGVKKTGATLHLVDEDFDTGHPFKKRRVKVKKGDTPATLAKRVQTAERYIITQALRQFAATRRVRIVENGEVRVDQPLGNLRPSRMH